MNKNATFDPVNDFTHIAYIGGSPAVLVAHPSLGVKNLHDLLARAAASPTGIDYVSPGVGAVGNLAAEYLATKANVKLRHVPYRGGAPALVDLIAGHVKLGCMIWSTISEHVRAGELIPIAISSPTRLPDFPNLPTFAELGYGDIVLTAWFSLSGPPKMPRAIVDRLNQAVNAAMTNPEVSKILERETALTRAMSPDEFTQFLRAEVEKWTPVVKGLKQED
jgi:tripartite-type tricarboxylate transporter receptor subunit TctC